MSVFHLTEDGPKICKASKRQCPYGGEENHFHSRSEAIGAFEKKLANEHGLLSSLSSTPTRNLENAKIRLDSLKKEDEYINSLFTRLSQNENLDYSEFWEELEENTNFLDYNTLEHYLYEEDGVIKFDKVQFGADLNEYWENVEAEFQNKRDIINHLEIFGILSEQNKNKDPEITRILSEYSKDVKQRLLNLQKYEKIVISPKKIDVSRENGSAVWETTLKRGDKTLVYRRLGYAIAPPSDSNILKEIAETCERFDRCQMLGGRDYYRTYYGGFSPDPDGDYDKLGKFAEESKTFLGSSYNAYVYGTD